MTISADRWQVLGLGRLGTPLAAVLHDRNLLVGSWTRSDRGRGRAAEAGVPAPSTDLDVGSTATHVLVAVPDDAIGRVCAAVGEVTRARDDLVWLHCSGSLGGEVIRNAGVSGAVGSCHPLVSMTGKRADVSRLRGAFFAVEGDAAALRAAESLVALVGGNAERMSLQSKLAYHCAATLASNGVFALLAAARRLTQLAGVDSDVLHNALARLASESAANADGTVLEEVATGPVVRGDAGTVRAHLDLLRREDHQLRELYMAVSREMIALGESAGARESAMAAVATVLEDTEA